MSRPSASTPLNADPRVVVPDTTKITRYRTIDVDDLKLFYREARIPRHPRCCCCTAFRPSSICRATLFRRSRTVITSLRRIYQALVSPKRPNSKRSSTASSILTIT